MLHLRAIFIGQCAIFAGAEGGGVSCNVRITRGRFLLAYQLRARRLIPSEARIPYYGRSLA